jgi:hypothetical protein
MRYTKVILAVLAGLALAVSACSSLAAPAMDACPITAAPDPAFVPPQDFPQKPPREGHFWYGSSALWTTVPQNGQWPQLALGEKVFLWNESYDPSVDPFPALTITGRQLDGAATYESDSATNAEHPDLGVAILVGVELPEPGCWEISAEYQGTTLSFVVWVEP